MQYIKSRNLIPYPYFYYDQANKTIWTFPYTTNGITFTESNGIITANGTATSDIWFRFAEKIPFNTGDKFSLSGMTTIGSRRTFRVNATLYNAETKKEIESIYDYGNGATTNTMSVRGSINCYIVISSGTTLYNVQFKPMLNKGSTPLPYEPYMLPFKVLKKTKNLYTLDYNTLSAQDFSNATLLGVGKNYMDVQGTAVAGSSPHVNYNSRGWFTAKSFTHLPQLKVGDKVTISADYQILETVEIILLF